MIDNDPSTAPKKMGKKKGLRVSVNPGMGAKVKAIKIKVKFHGDKDKDDRKGRKPADH